MITIFTAEIFDCYSKNMISAKIQFLQQYLSSPREKTNWKMKYDTIHIF